MAAEVPVPQTPANSDLVTLKADTQEKDGDQYSLRGHVEIDYREYRFFADQVTYHQDSGQITATGHVSLEGGNEDVTVQGDRATYNLKTEQGKFYNVVGTAGMHYKGGSRVVLTTDAPFAFHGKEVDKIGKYRYVLHDGVVTSCRMPHPKWTFRSGKVDFTIGGVARIYNTSFNIKDIPVLYLPYAQHPVEELGRHTGFLVPTGGASSRKGIVLGDSFYWAINRSMDTTLGAEYFSQRGWAQHGEFRARPDENSTLNVTYFGVVDRGTPVFDQLQNRFVEQDQGGEDAKITGVISKLPFGFTGGISAEYLSRYIFRLAFTENFSQAVNSEVKSVAFVNRAINGYDFGLFLRRYQNFQSTNPGDVITIDHLPSAEFNSVDRPLFGRLYFGFDSAVEGLSRKQPGLQTANSVGRIDAHPHLTVPVFLRGWTLRPEGAVRDTFYTQRLQPTGAATLAQPQGSTINRRDVELGMELRPPTLVRVFDKPVFGHKLKHTIEPHLQYQYVNGISNFNEIIRFDQRDILSDTNEIEYGVTQRFYTKNLHPKPCKETPKNEHPLYPDVDPTGTDATGLQPVDECAPVPGEFLSWELAQRYYFDQYFGGAVVAGVRNVFTTSEQLTGIAFITGPRSLSPVISRLRMHTTARSQLEWALDYDSKFRQLTSSNLVFDYRLGDQWTVGASHAYLVSPGEVFTTLNLPAPAKFNQYRLLAGYGNPGKRGFSIAGNVGVDANFNNLQYSAGQIAYNWDCCGVSLEYRRFALGSVRNENQFRFAFSLANIGTFGNLKRQERLF
ncbi:MAG TPA: LPS assembly protein LptD [Terriglobales bacterium]